MTPRQQFIKTCKYHGVAGYVQPEARGVIEAEAPPGKVFRASGTHLLTSPFNTQFAGYKDKGYLDIAGRVSLGLENCTEPDCEPCAEPFGLLSDTKRIA